MRRLLGYLFYKVPKIPGFMLRDWIRISRERRKTVRGMLNSMLHGKELLDDGVQEIKASTLILWGANDKLIPPEIGRRLVSLMPNAHLELLEDCGHNLLQECLSTAIRLITEWLD